MRRVGYVCLILAWAAALLPWERCNSDCHDLLVPAFAEHHCHHHHEHSQDQFGDSHPHADHETVELDFDFRHPELFSATVATPAPPTRVAPVEARPAEADPAPAARLTTVMLL